MFTLLRWHGAARVIETTQSLITSPLTCWFCEVMSVFWRTHVVVLGASEDRE